MGSQMTLQVVVGGQFGSEAKGAVTAAICADEVSAGHRVTVVRVGGPNAGHSAYDPEGRLWALRQVPAGMVVDPEVRGVIADGSEIDLEVLDTEIRELESAGHKVRGRLIVSGEATIIDDAHKARETELIAAVGSTGKGIGAARAGRLMRNAQRVLDLTGPELTQLPRGVPIAASGELGPYLTGIAREYGEVVVVEGTQGYGLGLHAGFYPQCTSGDVRAVDAVAQCGINPWGPISLSVHVVVRPYPIRVAGNSGPLRGETTWAELGLGEELTTVTRKVRRVGEWDHVLVANALAANGPGAKLAVSMIDQLPGHTEREGDSRRLTEAGWNWLRSLEEELLTTVRWYGVGPRVADWRIFS